MLKLITVVSDDDAAAISQSITTYAHVLCTQACSKDIKRWNVHMSPIDIKCTYTYHHT